jgi:hypothetical protein
MIRTWTFTREQLRAPFTLTLLIVVPAIFVASASGALSEFAAALGGSVAGDAAAALGAGWAAAYVAGALGFFQAVSARGADRRLALAGLGPTRVAVSRIGASLVLALVAGAAGFAALEVRGGVAHPLHAAVAVLGFAVLYLAVGVLIGSLVTAPLEGSLIVTFVFLLDVFAGPGMAESPAPWAISRKAGDILLASGAGISSPTGDFLELALVTAAALGAALIAFIAAARSRV